MVLVFVHAFDHSDLVDDIVDADEQLGLFFDGVLEDLDGAAEGRPELLVASGYFTGLFLALASR
jgi:hypothetical protein